MRVILAFAAFASRATIAALPGLAAGAPLVALPILALLAPAPRATPPRVPPIVFVSRAPAAESGVVPGLGPHHRTLATGGRLMLRAADGARRALLPEGRLFDCADPAVSFDGTRVAFAGTVHRDSAWRIWIVGIDGRGLARVTDEPRGFDVPESEHAWADLERFDDTDPCWVGDRLLCFVSTRFPHRTHYGRVPVSNLYLVRDDGSALRRLTAERGGAESPAFDPLTGRIIYGRWWFNRWLAAANTRGITEDQAAALPRDSINLWQVVEIRPHAHGPKLAAGSLGSRRDAMGVEPALARDGSVFATFALNLGLSPRPGPTGVHRLPARGGRAERIAGALVPERGGDPYGSARGLAAPIACAPAVLPDGRVILSYAPGGRGDLGLWVANRSGSRLEPLLDLPGTLELDAAPVAPRAHAQSAWNADPGISPAADAALLRGALDDPALGTFTFACEDVFAGGGLAGAPLRVADARLRFFATVPRLDREGGDTAVVVREVAVTARGAIHATGLPAGVPMFEQLIDAKGAVLLTAHGPAHVPGLNAGTAGAVTRCIGCHTGHSRLPVRGAFRP